MDDPYAHVGGDPHPIVTNRDTVYPPFGAFGHHGTGYQLPARPELERPGSNENAGGAVANLNSGQFGRITTQAGAPRIVQLGIKYAF